MNIRMAVDGHIRSGFIGPFDEAPPTLNVAHAPVTVAHDNASDSGVRSSRVFAVLVGLDTDGVPVYGEVD